MGKWRDSLEKKNVRIDELDCGGHKNIYIMVKHCFYLWKHALVSAESSLEFRFLCNR